MMIGIGSKVLYDIIAMRAGEVLDESECGEWFLVRRHDVQEGEQERVAVMKEDPSLKEVRSR